MKTRHKKYEFINGKWTKVQSEWVTFIRITGSQSAIVTKNGKQMTVKRSTLLDVPNHILYPDIPIMGSVDPDPEVWKRGSYFY